MKAYKGFNKDMTCRGFQYEEGKTYETDEAKMCNSGFHACINPLDCFQYYAPGTSEYHEVDIDDNGERQSSDSKVVGKKITIGAKLSVPTICKLHFEYTKSLCTNHEQGKDNTCLSGGDRSSLAGGDRSSLAGGDRSSLAGGDRSSLAGGDYSSLAGGDRSSLAGGDRSSLAGGKDSILSCFSGRCKAGIGSIITIANRKLINGKYYITDFCSAIVDGIKIKADTWYRLENGKFVEAEVTDEE